MNVRSGDGGKFRDFVLRPRERREEFFAAQHARERPPDADSAADSAAKTPVTMESVRI